jgi:hypothetical protein
MGIGNSSISKSRLKSSLQLRDFHAEALARRAFNKFLIEEVEKISTNEESVYFEKYKGKLRLKPSWELTVYCSKMPCGDCSYFKDPNPELMSLTNACSLSKYKKSIKTKENRLPNDNGKLKNYEVRIKPVRRDFPVESIYPSLSCSDKFMYWCFLGVQGKYLSALYWPIKPRMMMLPDTGQDLRLLRKKVFNSLSVEKRIEKRKKYTGIFEKLKLSMKERKSVENSNSSLRSIEFFSRVHEEINTQKAEKANSHFMFYCVDGMIQEFEHLNPKFGLLAGSSAKVISNPKCSSTFLSQNFKLAIQRFRPELEAERTTRATLHEQQKPLKHYLASIGYCPSYFIKKSLLNAIFLT